MKFLNLHLFHKVEHENIAGYDDIKDIVRHALSSEENYNLLLCGPPASAKTLLLNGILECRKGVCFDAQNESRRNNVVVKCLVIIIIQECH
jgi:thiamine monophosphate kinase